ncbi:hypothetical protein ACSBR2_022025 [Camellia fascicularis]
MEKEISSGSIEDCDEINIETEIEDTKNVEVEIEDPQVEMTYKSIDEIYEYYSRYGKRNGFAVSKKYCKMGDNGEKKYVTIACTHARKAKIKTSNIVKLHPQTKTECKTGLNANLQGDGIWILRSLRLEHNHEMSPRKSHFFKQNRILEPHVKRRLELNDSAGIRMNKNFTSLVVEAGGHEHLSYLEKDCRNHMDKVRHLKLEKGDATAMYNYFVKMQADNSEFFYVLDLDEEGRLLNEFEENWNNLIENYQLESNKWLFGLFEARHQWIPAFVKDIFWVGMSTTQRSESMHAFFDGYINLKTTLKQFVEQYENALEKKVENENGEEFNSLNSYIPCITQYPFEKQFQKAYTIAKFKEFQQEAVGQLHCNLSLEIVCRHQIVVLMKERVHEISDKYILRRWNKNVKRCHSKVIINYDNSSMLPETRRYNKMFNVFNDVVNLATDCENRCDIVVEQLLELKGKLKEEVEIDCGNKKSSFVSNHHNSTTHGDGVSKSKESRTMLDPVVLRQKGRPPCKRK